MEFREIYCLNCTKVLGRYNIKFYNDEKVRELLNLTHSTHVRSGHHVTIRKFEKN